MGNRGAFALASALAVSGAVAQPLSPTFVTLTTIGAVSEEIPHDGQHFEGLHLINDEFVSFDSLLDATGFFSFLPSGLPPGFWAMAGALTSTSDARTSTSTISVGARCINRLSPSSSKASTASRACRFYAIFTAGLRATNPGRQYGRFVTKSETISQLVTPEG